MISKRKRLSWIIMVVFLFSMVLPGFIQPAQAVSISIVSVSPADGATQVPLATPITATYSEPIFPGPHFPMISMAANQALIGTSAAINGSILSIMPTSGLLPNTTYTVTIPPTAVQDGAGNSPQEARVFSFTTVAGGGGGSGVSPITLTYDLAADQVSLPNNYSSSQIITLTSPVENVFSALPNRVDLWKVDSSGAITGTAPVWGINFSSNSTNTLSFELPVLSLETGLYAWVIGAYPPATVHAAHFEITSAGTSGGSTEAWLDVDNSALKTELGGSSSFDLYMKNITFDRAELSIDYDPAMSAVTANAWCPGVSDDNSGFSDIELTNGWHRSTFTIIGKDASTQVVGPLTIGESGDTVYKVSFTNLNHEGTVPVSLGTGSSSSCYLKLNVYYNNNPVPVTVPADTFNTIPGTTLLSFTDKAHIAYAVDYTTRVPIGNGSIQYKISTTDAWQTIDASGLSVDSTFGGYFFNSPTNATEDTAYQFLAEGYQTTSIDKYPDWNWNQTLYHYTFTANKNTGTGLSGIFLPYQGTEPFATVFANEQTFTIPMIDVGVPIAMGDAIPTFMLYDQQNILVAHGTYANHNVNNMPDGYWHMFGGVNMVCINEARLIPGVYQLKAVLGEQQSNAILIVAEDGLLFSSVVEPYYIAAGSQSVSFIIRGYKIEENLAGLSAGLRLVTYNEEHNQILTPITLDTAPTLALMPDDPAYPDQDRLMVSYNIPSPGLNAGNYQIELNYYNNPVSFISGGGSLEFEAIAEPFISKVSPANPQAGGNVKVYGDNLSGKTFDIYMCTVGSAPADPVASDLTPVSAAEGGQYLEFTIPTNSSDGTYILYAVDTATGLSIIGNLGFNISGAIIDHPVVNDIWPKWIAVGTTEGWINLNGVGFNFLGESPSLKITVKDTNNEDVVVAESTEINIGSDGRWMSAKVHSVSATGVTPAEIYNGSIQLTGNTVAEFCNNWIGITSQPLIYGEIEPWAISRSQSSATLKLYGANLDQLGTSQIQVYMANKADPRQAYFGTAQVGENEDGRQYLQASFSNLNFPVNSSGSYFLAADNPPVTIHGMVDEATVTDTSAAVEVVDTPAVTNVILQANNTLLIEGVNFNQFVNMSAVAGVISDPANPTASPYIQPVTRITGSSTQLQVVLPANITVNKNYVFDLYDNAGTASEQWIPQSWWFYIPAVSNVPSVPLTFTDQDLDHVYFDGDNISFEITLSQLNAIPPNTSVPLNSTSGVWTDGTNFISTDPSLKNYTVVAQTGKLVVSGYVNNPVNNTLPTGCMGLKVILPDTSEIGPFGIISSTGTKAIAGVQIPLPEGVVCEPAFETIADLANVSNLKFTQTGFGSIQFTDPIDLYHNFQQAQNLSGGISVEYDSGNKIFYVEVNTEAMSFLAGKAATITLLNVPFASQENLVISSSDPTGVTSEINLNTETNTLTFNVNHFSTYIIYEETGSVGALTGTMEVWPAAEGYEFHLLNASDTTPGYYYGKVYQDGSVYTDAAGGSVDVSFTKELVGTNYEYISVPIIEERFPVGSYTMKIYSEAAMTTEVGNIGFTIIPMVHITNPGLHSTSSIADIDITGYISNWSAIALNGLNLNLNGTNQDIKSATYLNTTTGEFTVPVTLSSGYNRFEVSSTYTSTQTSSTGHTIWGETTYTPAGGATDAVIDPLLMTYDRYTSTGDLQTNITWNMASAITKVEFSCPDLTIPVTQLSSSYWSLSGNVLSIKKDFLLGLKEHYTYTFNVTFNAGNPATMSVYVINNPPGPITLTPDQFTAGSPIGFNLNFSTMYFGTASRIAVVKDTNDPPAQVLPPMPFSGYDNASQVSWAGNTISTPGQYQLLIYDGDPVSNPSAVLKATGNFSVIPDVAPNTAPTVSGLTIFGVAAVGQVLAADYDYNDADGDLQGATEFQWYTLETVPGNYTPISGATAATYTITAAELGKYISVWVTPVATDGVERGTVAVSDPTAQVTATVPLQDFSIGSVQLFNGLGDAITSVGAQGGYRIKAQIINNTAAAENALVIIQVRNGSGATATGGGKVLGLGGVETAIPTTGSNISCSFTLPSGLSGTAYVDVFVWDGWDDQAPLADPYQTLTFEIAQ